MSERHSDEKPGRPAPKTDRTDRKAAALRANLARRKAQKKSRSSGAATDGKQG